MRKCFHLILLTLLVCLCGCLNIPYKAKRIIVGEKTYALNFNESTAYAMLDRFGVTNRYVDNIQRDSRGAALFVFFVEIGRHENRSALIVTESGCVVTNFPSATSWTGLRDDLTEAYSLEGDRYVFAGGQSMRANGKTKNSWLSVIAAPGNELLALRYSDEPDYHVVFFSDPQKFLFRLDGKKDIPVQKIFYKDGTIFVFGTVYEPKDKAHWECWTYRSKAGTWQRESQITIPDAEEVLDLDPESSSVLCYRWGLLQKKAFVFNLDTKETSKVGLKIWRDHGYFLLDGVVTKIKATLNSHPVVK